MQTTLTSPTGTNLEIFAEMVSLYLRREILRHTILMVDADATILGENKFNEIQQEFSDALNPEFANIDRWINEQRELLVSRGFRWFKLDAAAARQGHAKFLRPDTRLSMSVGSNHWVSWSGSTGASTSAGFYFDDMKTKLGLN